MVQRVGASCKGRTMPAGREGSLQEASEQVRETVILLKVTWWPAEHLGLKKRSGEPRGRAGVLI